MSAVALERRPKKRQTAVAKPFTVEHFRTWAKGVVLDNEEAWIPEPFQLAFIEDVFAGKPECWLVVPEGNGKTTLVAGLALYVCEFSPTPTEIPVAASSREQSGILFRQAEGFVLRSPRLYERVHSDIQEIRGKRKLEVPRFVALPGYRRIDHYAGSRIQVFAADDRTGDGVLFKLGILDELHRHRTLDLYRTWVGKRSKRGGQIIAISTAGEPGSEFETTRERIRQESGSVQRKGRFIRAASEEIVLHEWALSGADDVEDLELVKSCNPFSRITVKDLASKRRSPTMTLAHWSRFTCNLPTRGDTAAIQEVEWHGAKTGEQIPAGVPIWLGLDVAWKWDTTAAVPYWHRDDKFRLFGPAAILVPPRDGTSLDPNLVEAALIGIHRHNPIHTVVMNVQVAGQTFANWVISEIGAVVVDRGQTPVPAAEDYERFMEGLRNGKLKHSGDQGLTAHALHAIARVDPVTGKARFDRPSQTRDSIEQEHRVIDALTAAARVHAQAMVPLEEEAEFHMAVR